MVRASGTSQVDPARFTAGQALLGEPLWRPPSPKGYADDEATWIDGMGRRLDVANNFADIAARSPDYVVETVLASTISSEAKQAVARAGAGSKRLRRYSCRPSCRGGMRPSCHLPSRRWR
jgi:uncharacterized protein (DUF1800 family)